MQVALPLRFHWHPFPENLLEAGKLVAESRYAEECSFESIAVQAGLLSETFLTSLIEASRATKKIKFLVRCEANPVPKWNYLQQIRVIPDLSAARVNIYLPFDQDGSALCPSSNVEAYDSSIREFLRECSALSDPRPEIFVEGVSAEAAELAIKFADCLWLKPKRAEQIYSDALPALHMGKEVGLHTILIARETTEKAHAVAAKLLPDGSNRGRESEDGSCIWEGTLSPQCPDGIALAGSFVEIAETLMRYKEKGISQFLFGAPQGEPVMTYFAAGVLPIVRKLEADGVHEMKVAG